MGDMNAPLRVRIKEGCRGGREQFTWNSIKEQDFKDREQYLGQSTKVGMMGKFGRYHVHDWYARKRDTTESIATEQANVQKYEEELMQEALGLKPKRLLLSKKQMSEDELREVLKRDEDKSEDKKGMTAMGPQKKLVTNEYGEQIATSNEDYVAQAARDAPIKGLGFAMHRNAKLEAIKAETFGTEGQLEGSKSVGGSSSSTKVEPKEEVKREVDDDARSTLGVADAHIKEEHVQVKRELADADGAPSSKRHRDGEDRKQSKEKKAEKKRKKAEKKLKKIEKKLKKVAKKERKSSSKGKSKSSSSSSSS